MVMWIVGIFAFLLVWTICSYFYLAYVMHPEYRTKWYSKLFDYLFLPPFIAIAAIVCWVTLILDYFDKH